MFQSPSGHLHEEDKIKNLILPIQTTMISCWNKVFRFYIYLDLMERYFHEIINMAQNQRKSMQSKAINKYKYLNYYSPGNCPFIHMIRRYCRFSWICFISQSIKCVIMQRDTQKLVLPPTKCVNDSWSALSFNVLCLHIVNFIY